MTSHIIYSSIVGRDTIPVPVAEKLTDWFGLWLSEHAQATHPATLRDLLTKVLPRHTWVPFALGDGTFLHYSDANKHINRRLRFTIVSTPGTKSMPPVPVAPVGDIDQIVRRAFREQTVCVVASSNFDRPDVFLQVASWDAEKRRLNFYERLRRQAGYDDTDTTPIKGVEGVPEQAPVWHYLGSSFDAFAPDTHGQGPFCGHVNGTLVMKELNNPWIHWHSTRYQIHRTFAPDDAIFTEELLQPPNTNRLSYIALGDRFEMIVQTATSQWYNSRLDRDLGPRASPHTSATNILSWMRHLLTTTTVNIAGSRVNSEVIINEKGDAQVPQGFFFNDPVIEVLLPHEVIIPTLGSVKSEFYNAARIKLGLKTIYDWKNMGIAFEHEGQTPWCVMVPSLEDSQGVNMIRHRNLLPSDEILSLLMVDFPNPVYSYRRGKLLQYSPDTCTFTAATGTGTGTYNLSASFRAAVSASPAAQDPSSPESEFLRNLTSTPVQHGARITAYMDKVRERLQTSAGVEDYMLLAESRRRIFRPFPSSRGDTTNPLSEFIKTLPYATLIPQEWKHLEMTEDAEVRVMGDESQDYVQRKIAERFMQTPKQCHTVDAEGGCPY